VTVAGPLKSPLVLDRRRLILADPDSSPSKQPYHAAEGLALPKARELVDRHIADARKRAGVSFSHLAEELAAKGLKVSRCAVLEASGRPLPSFDRILASHALIHAAEGEHFRGAVRRAASARRLTCLRLREKEILGAAAKVLHLPAAAIRSRLTALGKPLGAPWTQDEKLAALAAWVALASR
jgi:hypothetical protein